MASFWWTQGAIRSTARALASATFLTSLTCAGAWAQEPAAFYKGKQISIYVGFAAGGGYDAYARLLARHMPAHMPGEPGVIVKNMFGAAGEQAANFVANIAPKDGLAIASVSASQPLNRIFIADGQRTYDPAKQFYLGSATRDDFVCLMGKTSPAQSADDLFLKETVLGSGALRSGTLSYMPLLAQNLLGAKYKLINGYKGTIEIMMALERGEVHGVCGINLSSVQSQFSHFVQNGSARIVVQESIKGDPNLNRANIPRLYDYAKTDKQRKIIRTIYAQGEFARPFFVAGGVPEDRVRALRAGFINAFGDQELISEAAKMNLTVDPIAGDVIQAIVGEIAQEPESFIDEVKAAIDLR